MGDKSMGILAPPIVRATLLKILLIGSVIFFKTVFHSAYLSFGREKIVKKPSITINQE
jgi:hypothetical protein